MFSFDIYHSLLELHLAKVDHISNEYCFFFQIPLNRLLNLNFFSVESAINWATESFAGLTLPAYSEKNEIQVHSLLFAHLPLGECMLVDLFSASEG